MWVDLRSNLLHHLHSPAKHNPLHALNDDCTIVEVLRPKAKKLGSIRKSLAMFGGDIGCVT